MKRTIFFIFLFISAISVIIVIFISVMVANSLHPITSISDACQEPMLNKGVFIEGFFQIDKCTIKGSTIFCTGGLHDLYNYQLFATVSFYSKESQNPPDLQSPEYPIADFLFSICQNAEDCLSGNAFVLSGICEKTGDSALKFMVIGTESIQLIGGPGD